jgi:folate-binding protein YgfZ
MPIARLDDRAVVRIAGPDAGTLLQNVATLDIGDVDRQGSGYGALLTPQGKILWDFILHRRPDGYAADLRAGELDAFIKRLTLYRLRAKVEISPAPELAVFVAWPATEGHPPDPRLPALGSRWVALAGSTATNATVADWHRHRLALAVPEGDVDFAFGDAFPHDAAMDSLHGVAFDKGCYIGQEVVSRMLHRGTARRRIVAVNADAPLPEPGAEIFAGDRPLGRLGSSADGKGIGLVRLDRTHAALEAGVPIRVGSQGVRVTLPGWATYGWPADAAAGED